MVLPRWLCWSVSFSVSRLAPVYSRSPSTSPAPFLRVSVSPSLPAPYSCVCPYRRPCLRSSLRSSPHFFVCCLVRLVANRLAMPLYLFLQDLPRSSSPTSLGASLWQPQGKASQAETGRRKGYPSQDPDSNSTALEDPPCQHYTSNLTEPTSPLNCVSSHSSQYLPQDLQAIRKEWHEERAHVRDTCARSTEPSLRTQLVLLELHAMSQLWRT